jgi:hypothetical protein
MKKLFYILFALVLALIFGLVTASPMATPAHARAEIQVLSPDGSAAWECCSLHDILWYAPPVTRNVRIQLSRNGGTTWTTIFSNTPNDGGQTWRAACPATNNARIRVISASNPNVLGISSNFRIIPPTTQSITVVSPNGGQRWVGGRTYIITWTSADVGVNVNIQLSRDSGRTWTTIISNTPNDGSQSWRTPVAFTTHARIKVVSTCSSNVFDTSEADFSIIY